jgi:hypothetical protein
LILLPQPPETGIAGVHHYEQFLSIFFLEILMKLMIKIVEVDK